MEFLNPARLWFLLLVPLFGGLYWALLSRRRTTRDLRIPGQRQQWKSHVAVALALASLAALNVAWARPKQQVPMPRERATVVVVIDVSLSMEADDVKPNRLKAAQEAATEFVNSMPPRFNVALVEFAGTATTVVPPTTDRSSVVNGIESLRLQERTAIGEGIAAGLKAAQSVPPAPDDDTPAPAVMVVLSDGETTTGRDPYRAAETSKNAGVPVHTIAYGTISGRITDKRTGRSERVPVNVPHLKGIAKEGGGKGYSADSAEQLKEVYSDIRATTGVEMVDAETTTRYAGLGLIFAIAACLGIASLAARWP